MQYLQLASRWQLKPVYLEPQTHTVASLVSLSEAGSCLITSIPILSLGRRPKNDARELEFSEI